MRRGAAALALVLAVLAGPAPAQQQGGAVMDRLVALFEEGRPIGFQVAFEALGTEHDLDVNTTVGVVRDAKEGKERLLIVATAPYERGGDTLRFVFAIKEGLIAHFDLQRRAGDEWKSVPQDVFWFQVLDEKVPPDALESGDVVLYARGVSVEGRGSRTRARATVALRSFHAPTGSAPAY